MLSFSVDLFIPSVHRPSIEKIFASGWDDSSFFFGAPESHLTLPVSRRERSELSKALAYPLRNRCAVTSSLSKSDHEDSNSIKASSLLSNSGFGVSEDDIDDIDDITATYDNDSFVLLGACSPIHVLPSLLWGTMKFPLRDTCSLALLATRRMERAMLLLSTSSVLFQDVGMA